MIIPSEPNILFPHASHDRRRLLLTLMPAPLSPPQPLSLIQPISLSHPTSLSPSALISPPSPLWRFPHCRQSRGDGGGEIHFIESSAISLDNIELRST